MATTVPTIWSGVSCQASGEPFRSPWVMKRPSCTPTMRWVTVRPSTTKVMTSPTE